MKRFMVFGQTMEQRIGTASTREQAIGIIKKNGKGNGNIIELNDEGETYKAYGVMINPITNRVRYSYHNFMFKMR